MLWLFELTVPALTIAPPSWLSDFYKPDRLYPSDEDKIRFAIALAQENIDRGTGGPFAAAIFESARGHMISVGVNQVVAQHNACLHAEIMAIMMAGAILHSHTFQNPSKYTYVLATSCDPCAMCLGAVLWSGVHHLLCAATSEDARAIGFNEGPIFSESWAYVQNAGVSIARGILREQARTVLHLYRERGGPMY